ncbi:histidine kinase [Chitinophaga skermanii]|uniref:Histidine kinase n=1 Tax=Chitinophaga skermanii TaxID=331697 RepID=A0A327QSN3_9BACT|nr:sensor histidine kinase [Chitinophaga skermanii]RAJ06915.1 histidine kinase [Chitinophaga skermanii]
MRGKWWQICLHVVGCVLFLCLPILFSPDQLKLKDIILQPPRQRDFIAYCLMLVFFYSNYFIFIPKFYFTKRYWVFSFITIACFIFIVSVPIALTSNADYNRYRVPPREMVMQNQRMPPRMLMGNQQPFRRPPNSVMIGVGRHLFLFLAVVLLSLMLKISNRWKQSEQERLKSEVAYLKAQINPHFLFNSLNSIYALALQRSEATATAIVKLSGMMRYVTSEAGNDFVPLEKEIDYIRNYFALQKLRFGEAVPTELHISGHMQGKKITPLLLIPFVENAFKHGVNAEEDSLVVVNIDMQHRDLIVDVYNRKVPVRLMEEEKIGLGIENTRQRLQMIYPAKHTFEIVDTDTSYRVKLTIQLTA